MLGEVIDQHDRLKVIMQPAKCANVSKWLASLGVLLAGKMSIDEAKVRIAAYTELLDMPEYCYTKESLGNAAREFQWWPSFKELDDFLGTQKPEIARTYWRLDRLRRLPTDEEIAEGKAAEEAEKLAKMLARPGGRITHKWGHLFSMRCTFDWWRWKDDAVERHGEALVDAWHEEVAALDWTKSNGDIFEDFNPLAALKERERRFVAAQQSAEGALERDP